MDEDLKKLSEAVGKNQEELKSELAAAREADKLELSETKEKLAKLDADFIAATEKYDQLSKEIATAKMPSMNKDGDTLSEEEQACELAIDKYLRSGVLPDQKAVLNTLALASAPDSAGGTFITQQRTKGLLMDAYNFSNFAQIASVMRTSKDSVAKPKLQKPIVSWGVIGQQETEQNLTAGQETIDVKSTSALILIHNHLLADADFDVWSEIRNKFPMAQAEAEGIAFVTGATPDTPEGILTNTSVIANVQNSGVAADISSTTIALDGRQVLDQLTAIPKATYARNASFMMNRTTASAVRRLTNQQGEYLWEPSTQVGTPSKLLGYPVHIEEGMPAIAANALPILFGDFKSGYQVVERQGLTIQRLDEKYADYNSTGFIVRRRIGGGVVLPEAFAVLKCAV